MDSNLSSAFQDPHQLNYSIHSCSNCSSNYHPFNILEDIPIDPSSRWSGSGPSNPSNRSVNQSDHLYKSLNLSNQHSNYIDSIIYPGQLPKKKDYIILDLGKPCIVQSITFGKFHRPHPCNVKLFRIWGSLAPGEGKGDFRALLDYHPNHPQSLDQNPNNHNHNNQSQFNSSNQPSSTNSNNQSINNNPTKTKDNQSSSNHQDENSSIKFNSANPTFQKIKPRGERHHSGPRMELLAQGELKNDSIPETVPLRWKNSHVPWFSTSNTYQSKLDSSHHQNHNLVIVPIRYIKIEPLSSAGSNYNCSIWHIAINGHDEDHLVQHCLQVYEKWKASAALRLCLKHLRQTGHFEAFQALIKSSSSTSLYQSPILVPPITYSSSNHASHSISSNKNVEPVDNLPSSNSAQFHFEHSLVSALHSVLVPQLDSYNHTINSSTNPSNLFNHIGQISAAEQIIFQAASEGLFDDWANAEPPTLTCHQIEPTSTSLPAPGPRGGHQMCIDSKRRIIWMFGGFDGYSDLGDLWAYTLSPSNLSDHNDQHSYTIADHTTSKQKVKTYYPASLGALNAWHRLSRQVSQQGGPINRSCHKMVLDDQTGDLYILGRYTERGRASNSKLPSDSVGLETGSANGATLEDTHLQPESTASRVPSDILRPNVRVARTNPQPIETLELPPTPQPLALGDELMSEGDAAELGCSNNLSTSTSVYLKNDFYRFRPYNDSSDDFFDDDHGFIGRWECLSEDTYVEGGPKLIFDHQMVLDSDTRKIYVFGGKIIQPANSIPQEGHPSGPSSSRSGHNQYNGLYEYDLTTNKWTQLMNDPGQSLNLTCDIHSTVSSTSIPSRMGHSLILDKKRQCLWILTGERDNHYYSDLWKYDIANKSSQLVIADYTYGARYRMSSDSDPSVSGLGPEAGFSQRTTFDPEADEWHMFCGLCRDRGAGESNIAKSNVKSEMMSSEFWRWRIEEGRWTRVIMIAEQDGIDAPPPRFAHQMIFDELTKTHYVFGGNPADNDNEPIRLGDFWRLKLVQPTRKEAVRRALFALRRQHFIELCEQGGDTVGALVYLQNDLSSVTNHLDEQEARLFRACTSYLLTGPGPRLLLLESCQEDTEGFGDYLDMDEDLKIGELNQKSSAWIDNEQFNRNQRLMSRNQDNKQMIELLKNIKQERLKLFQDLSKFLPKSMTEPEESLMDLIEIWGDRETFW
ncbi:hypothetical protein O181_022311 [Austropuccinia psidii MF-1]|uniref:Muskelin N-terminal domain-containing protein n=1 Tax=Austropuccinia psidii MF-1 TaxID=1389203 RepID=A0A9Q3CCL7_9BASI|nr:hypothetical protein [Austropuccinia psidii MF-1]